MRSDSASTTVMAGLDTATHAVRQKQVAPGRHGAKAHWPVTRSRVGGRVKPGHDELRTGVAP
jgi:hypothetical protein